MVVKQDKKIQVGRCPRCGGELLSISDIDLEGHYVHCSKCGFTDDWISWKPKVLSDIDMEAAARPM